MTVKIADSKGRLSLGSQYANATFLIEESEGGVIVIKRAATVPVSEEWLYRNEKALNLVVRGLKDADDRNFSEVAPDLGDDTGWIDSLQD